MTAADLAERLTELGVKWNRSIVANFEGGRRPTVSVVEWLALAQVLNVAPLHLLVPTDVPGATPYRIAPNREAHVTEVRDWIRGIAPLFSENQQRWFQESPREEASPFLWISPNDPPKWIQRKARTLSLMYDAADGEGSEAEQGEADG